jgi:hypothetical protein
MPQSPNIPAFERRIGPQGYSTVKINAGREFGSRPQRPTVLAKNRQQKKPKLPAACRQGECQGDMDTGVQRLPGLL